MSYRPLTLEEFRIIRQYLKWVAERAIADSSKPRRHWWQFTNFGGDPAAAWCYYLQYDYFPFYKVPGLSEWHKFAKSLEHCSFFSNNFFEDFSLPLAYDKPRYWRVGEGKNGTFFPPNLQELETVLLKEWVDAPHSDTTA